MLKKNEIVALIDLKFFSFFLNFSNKSLVLNLREIKFKKNLYFQ
jgi:hypothetical protein